MTDRFYDFEERLAFSRGRRQTTAIATIEALIPGCRAVIKTEKFEDILGIDYKAQLAGGAVVYIDEKAREKGCSRYWNNGPEFALETWSVIPNGCSGKVGWTLDSAKQTDLVLFTFDPADCRDVFLVGFQHLRMAFGHYHQGWRDKYRTASQSSGTWSSECMFVPASLILEAITTMSQWSPV